MGVAFLTPLFLFGLLAVAVPILIHLYRREKSRLVAFPSLMFLERIPYRSVRQQRIRHWLLLLLRAAALVLLALAFARPLLRSEVTASPAVESRKDVVILLDRSFSMSYGDRWQRAKSAAREAISSLGAEDRARLVSFDERATALSQPTSDAAHLSALLDELEPGDRGTRLGPPLRLARRLLVDSALPRRQVVLISDLQRHAWSGAEGVRLPQGTELVQVDLSDATAANLAVASVSLDRSSGERQRVEISARITSRGATPFPAVPVFLELDGRTIQSQGVSLDANGSATVTFEPVSVGSGELTRGAVRLDGDSLAADNAFYFVLSPAQGISVLIVEEGGGRRAESLYLERALGLGQRPFFRVERRGASGLGESDLVNRDVVIVNDAGELSGAATAALLAFLERGGGLWLALGRASAERAVSSLARHLGLAESAVTDRTRDWGGILAFLDYTHPMLEVFSGPRSGDFSGARFFRYHDLSSLAASVAEGESPSGDESAARRVLARFDDGKPALVEVSYGEGHALVWASSLDTLWNNMPLQPVFLPLVHQIAGHLATYQPPREWYTVGQVAELDRRRRAGEDAGWLVLAPSGEQRTVDPSTDPLVPLDEQGFYEARPIGMAAEGDSGEEAARLAIAVNVDTSESDLTSLDPEELAAAIRPLEVDAAPGAETAATPKEREQRQRLWWYLLTVALLLLAVETAIANRLSTGRAGAVE